MNPTTQQQWAERNKLNHKFYRWQNYPSEIKKKRETFSDKWKLKEFITSKPFFKGWPEEVLPEKKKWQKKEFGTSRRKEDQHKQQTMGIYNRRSSLHELYKSCLIIETKNYSKIWYSRYWYFKMGRKRHLYEREALPFTKGG